MSRPSAAPDIERFIAQVKAAGGPERANLPIFVQELCGILGVQETPRLSSDENRLNDYVFERRVDFRHADGSTSPGWIDLYKRDCFVLEAKQSKKRGRAEPEAPDADLLGPRTPAPAVLGRGWDKVMIEARRQAENYARALPVDHGYPPFILVVDIGHVIEVFADFSGQGKNYAHFPDRTSYRIRMDDLRDDAVRARLKAILRGPTLARPGADLGGGHPRRRGAARAHRQAARGPARPQGRRRVPDALPVHDVRGGRGAPAGPGVLHARG
ncbi:type IIL restriction-modification enzyme MmeI [Salinarimonas rosea]|uniref:type IIL restriction-modification enzyme MmeI n=1 Tax=Salinarimonas rosea TaxID=552063 RepID=UPI000423FEA2|nr:type IIL restriction-modification enzyme MmeI [Salinarimonas rosea]